MTEKKNAEELMKLKVNKQLLQQHLCTRTGKVVTLKDITNVQIGLRHSASEGNNLEKLVKRLKSIDGEYIDSQDRRHLRTGLAPPSQETRLSQGTRYGHEGYYGLHSAILSPVTRLSQDTR